MSGSGWVSPVSSGSPLGECWWHVISGIGTPTPPIRFEIDCIGGWPKPAVGDGRDRSQPQV